MVKVIKKLVPASKYTIKCPYPMQPKGICIHNTANDASALSEVNYMISNNNKVSYHVAVDDKEVVECIDFYRNAWHAGDGNGEGNRRYIGIEICYSKSGGARFTQAELNAAEYVASLLKRFGWDISHVKKHQDFSGKYCPHRTLDLGWDRFINLIKKALGNDSVDGGYMGFISKYQKINWNGKTVHVYKQDDDQDIGLMSAKGTPDYKALQTIDKIDDDHVHYCKINCSYFEMTNQAEYGLHYGVEQGFTMNLAPKQEGLIVVYIDKDNVIHWTRSKDYWLNNTDVKLAFTPFCVNLANGKDEDDYSYNFGDKRKLSNTQTCLVQCADGKYAFVVFEGKVTPYQTRNFAKEYGCTFNCCLDSGGSSQMIVDGYKKLYTGRAIPNVLTFYKEPIKPETPTTPESCKNCEELKAINITLKAEIDRLNESNSVLLNANEQLENKLNDVSNELTEIIESIK